MNPHQTCDTCEHWAPKMLFDQTFSPTVGLCHERPPVPVGDGRTLWPETYHDSWCGQWRLVVDEMWRVLALEHGGSPDWDRLRASRVEMSENHRSRLTPEVPSER